MLPATTIKNSLNLGWGHFEQSRYPLASKTLFGVQPSHLQDLAGGEFRCPNLFSNNCGDPCSPVSPSLGEHISGVVLVSTKEEVVWTDTGRCIAMVTDEHPKRNWTEVQLPRDPVGKSVLIRPRHKNLAVSKRWGKQPTTITPLRDMAPKTFLKRSRPYICTPNAAKPRLSRLYCIRPSIKLPSTQFAKTLYHNPLRQLVPGPYYIVSC